MVFSFFLLIEIYLTHCIELGPPSLSLCVQKKCITGASSVDKTTGYSLQQQGGTTHLEVNISGFGEHWVLIGLIEVLDPEKYSMKV